jgi:hypothetical protein
MFKVILQTVGIIGAWGAGAWGGLFILSVLGIKIPDSSLTGILAFGLVAFATSLGMEVYDWCRLNVEKR